MIELYILIIYILSDLSIYTQYKIVLRSIRLPYIATLIINICESLQHFLSSPRFI